MHYAFHAFMPFSSCILFIIVTKAFYCNIYYCNRGIMSHSLFPTGHILWVHDRVLSLELGELSRWGIAREKRTRCIYKPTVFMKGIACVGAITVCPVFSSPFHYLKQVIQPAFSLPYSSSFQLRLCCNWLL